MEDDRNKTHEKDNQEKDETKKTEQLKSNKNDNKVDASTIQTQKLTFWQCLTVTKYAWLRFAVAFVLPIGLIGAGAYNWQKINWWLLTWPNIQTALLVVVGLIAVSWAIPWLLGTAIFGHILLPYIGFIMTGSFCYYTHGYPSVLVFNDKTYFKYDGAWYSLPDYYLQLLRDNGKELAQID